MQAVQRRDNTSDRVTQLSITFFTVHCSSFGYVWRQITDIPMQQGPTSAASIASTSQEISLGLQKTSSRYIELLSCLLFCMGVKLGR